jgi:aquaporin Z
MEVENKLETIAATSVSNVDEMHWPEYLMEAACLGMFMMSACVFGVLLEYPQSPLRMAIADPMLRRGLMGIAMGLTAIAIICSPWGQRSGAHMNPAVTLTFLSLGKIKSKDAWFYVLFQCLGAIAFVQIADALLGLPLRDGTVNYVVTLPCATLPGAKGVAAAFVAEMVISFVMMITLLSVSNKRELARFTPYFAGFLVAGFILVEAPVSGMSMNPARTLGSAFAAQEWFGFWVYILAPISGMMMAGMVYKRWQGLQKVFCAKLHHHNSAPCIFRCRFGRM